MTKEQLALKNVGKQVRLYKQGKFCLCLESVQ